MGLVGGRGSPGGFRGGGTFAEGACGDLYHVVLATILAMLVLPGVHLIGVCGSWIYSYTLPYHRGSPGDCTVGSGCRWTCSNIRLRSEGRAAAARSVATRRRGPRRRDDHAVADLSVTRRPRACLAPGHASAGPSATRRQRRLLIAGTACTASAAIGWRRCIGPRGGEARGCAAATRRV